MSFELQEKFRDYVSKKKGFSLTEDPEHPYTMIIYFKEGQYALRRLVNEEDKNQTTSNLDEGNYLIFWSEKPNRGATFAGFDNRSLSAVGE